jgi:PPOX class probable F420-dependent enzyme
MTESDGARIDAARAFIADGHTHGVLATTRRDGRPQLSPVTAVVDAEGRVVISTREQSAKVRNLRREPRASLVMMSDAFYGPWVQVDGTVEIVEQPEALDLLDDYYRRAAGEHPDWAEYRQAMIDQGRVLLRVPIERAGPVANG